MSPFTTVALALWQRGYSIVPLEPGDKAIKLPGWQRYCKERANRETLDMWLTWPDRNIGLALGPASGVIALDFDYDVDGRHADILHIIGDSPVKKRGAKGHTGFYRFSNQRSVKYSIGGESVLEILSTGRQTVLPPSIHPATRQPYEWLTRRTLHDVLPDDLPEITAEDMTAVDPGSSAVSSSRRPSCVRSNRSAKWTRATSRRPWNISLRMITTSGSGSAWR